MSSRSRVWRRHVAVALAMCAVPVRPGGAHIQMVYTEYFPQEALPSRSHRRHRASRAHGCADPKVAWRHGVGYPVRTVAR